MASLFWLSLPREIKFLSRINKESNHRMCVSGLSVSQLDVSRALLHTPRPCCSASELLRIHFFKSFL